MIGRTNATNPASEYVGIEYIKSIGSYNNPPGEFKASLPYVTSFGSAFVAATQTISVEINDITTQCTSINRMVRYSTSIQSVILRGDLTAVTDYYGAFDIGNNTSLRYIYLPPNNVKANLSVDWGTSLITDESIASIIAALYDYSGETDAPARTLTADFKERITTEQTAIATAKGWTIA